MMTYPVPDEEPVYTSSVGVPRSPVVPMDPHIKMRLRAAAHRAHTVYPGPVGVVLSRELRDWEEFGYRLGSASLIMELVDHIMKASPYRAA